MNSRGPRWGLPERSQGPPDGLLGRCLRRQGWSALDHRSGQLLTTVVDNL